MERKGGKRRRDRAGKTERETRVEGGNLQGWKVQRKGKSVLVQRDNQSDIIVAFSCVPT